MLIPRILAHRILWGASKCVSARRGVSSISEELTVQTFCDITIKLPFNVNLRPLDVNLYHNCDKLLITLEGADLGRETIRHIQDGNKIQIFSPVEDYNHEITCSVRAPIKANLDVVSHGNITTGSTNGSKLILKSLEGSIFVKRFHGEKIALETLNGDIHLNGAVIADDIRLVVSEEGSINAKRLQGNTCQVSTKNGNVTVDSSYCNNVTFDVTNGDADLQNIHKSSAISVTKGNLFLRGLDGDSRVSVKDGNADVQLSQISGESEVVVEKGVLNLYLSENCQKNTALEIETSALDVDEKVSLKLTNETGVYLLKPESKRYTRFKVQCKQGAVNVKHVTWEDVLKMHVNK